MTERVYLVGLPVAIVVSDSDTVTLHVCAEEAGEALRDATNDEALTYTEEELNADWAVVDYHFAAHTLRAAIDGQKEQA